MATRSVPRGTPKKSLSPRIARYATIWTILASMAPKLQNKASSARMQSAFCSSRVSRTNCIATAHRAIRSAGRAPHTRTQKLDEMSCGAVSQLLASSEALFLERHYGTQWMHSKASASGIALDVEDCLGLLSGFDAALHEDSRSRLKDAYRQHSAVLEDVSKAAPCGAKAARIWSGGPMSFWSVAICRTEDGSLEKIEDHKFVAHVLGKNPLQCTADLSQHGDNWTFIFNKAQGANFDLQSLHHSLWACFGVSGDINIYLTPPGGQGLAPHVDGHDVFVVQQAGEKTWTLLEPDKVSVLKNVTLRPGDVLYLPQGVPHYARSAGEGPSLHVTASVYRGHFTFAGLLAAWLELGASTSTDPFDQPRLVAVNIDASQTLLAKQGVDKANRPLPPALGLPLLRALDSCDLPVGLVRSAMHEAVLLAQQLAQQLHQKSDPEHQELAVKLEDLCNSPDEEKSRTFLDAVFASRGLRWIRHYRFYGPKNLRRQAPMRTSTLAGARLKRGADAAAMRSLKGDLLLNGYLISGLPHEADAALQFCMSRYVGAAGKAFELEEIPGPPEVAHSVVELLLDFDGLEYVEEKP